ncbi:uncharacterized protein VTP21DRAFT_7910 [Calcarisporiella thermophila]|uniref:uncharacterized protein n=1 Tax=Calcarisporiella thermophila TaxID=911321 RepID=UPI003744A312
MREEALRVLMSHLENDSPFVSTALSQLNIKRDVRDWTGALLYLITSTGGDSNAVLENTQCFLEILDPYLRISLQPDRFEPILTQLIHYGGPDYPLRFQVFSLLNRFLEISTPKNVLLWILKLIQNEFENLEGFKETMGRKIKLLRTIEMEDIEIGRVMEWFMTKYNITRHCARNELVDASKALWMVLQQVVEHPTTYSSAASKIADLVESKEYMLGLEHFYLAMALYTFEYPVPMSLVLRQLVRSRFLEPADVNKLELPGFVGRIFRQVSPSPASNHPSEASLTEEFFALEVGVRWQCILNLIHIAMFAPPALHPRVMPRVWWVIRACEANELKNPEYYTIFRALAITQIHLFSDGHLQSFEFFPTEGKFWDNTRYFFLDELARALTTWPSKALKYREDIVNMVRSRVKGSEEYVQEWAERCLES